MSELPLEIYTVIYPYLDHRNRVSFGNACVDFMDIHSKMCLKYMTKRMLVQCLVHKCYFIVRKQVEKCSGVSYDAIKYCIKTGRAEQLDFALTVSEPFSNPNRYFGMYLAVCMSTNTPNDKRQLYEVLIKHQCELYTRYNYRTLICGSITRTCGSHMLEKIQITEAV